MDLIKWKVRKNIKKKELCNKRAKKESQGINIKEEIYRSGPVPKHHTMKVYGVHGGNLHVGTKINTEGSVYVM
jgi:hypothetical protein